MKLGSLKSKSSLDGELVVVNREGNQALKVSDIAGSLQAALDRWSETKALLEKKYESLNAKSEPEAFPVSMSDFASPLPRAYQFLDGSAYLQHVRLVRKARGAELPDALLSIPLMYQGLSDRFLAPDEDIPFIEDAFGLDFEGEVAVITDHVPMGCKAEEAASHIKLIMLCNDISLRGLIPDELARGFGFVQSKPASAFSPFCVTPEELGPAWKDSKLHLNLDVEYNGKFFGNPDASQMHFSFAHLIEHAARTRSLAAGTILGSGTVSNEDTNRGSSCLAEKRMLEKINTSEITTPFMKPGDTIRIEMKNEKGQNIFGSIFQKVVQWKS